ncbi:chromosome partition protein Smc [Lachnospiraceae bacterium]|nr:chromosome partition protein Smc [Lachnospiraceae bacterium]
MRDPISIIRDLEETFNQLDENDTLRAEILTNIGGKHQATKLAALLQNMELFDKMLVDYSQGSGSAMEEAMKSANNWSGKINQLQNSWDSLVATVANKNAVLGGLTFGDKMIQGIEGLIEKFGVIPSILTAVNSSIVAMNKNYGLTKIWDKETKKIDFEGNFFGIDISRIKNLKKHYDEAKEAIQLWNDAIQSGEYDLESFGNKLVKSNAQFKAYLETTSKDAPASLSGYKKYLQSTGQATEDLRLQTILLNTALTFLGSIAVQAIITGFANAFDKFNETVVESKEKVDDINAKISDLKSQIEELNNLEYKSDFDKQKISQLEKELELQERILEVEQKRLYQNQIGTKFSDYFDADSLVTKQQSEYDRYNKEGFKYLSVRFEADKTSLADVESELTSLQDRLNSGTLTGHDKFVVESSIAKWTEKRNELLKEQQYIEEQLTLNMGEYLKNYQTAQEAVDSGLLTDSDLEKAKSMTEYWNQLYQDSSNIVTEIQKMNGTYDNTNDLLEGMFGGISRNDLVSLSDDDKRIALSFSPDNEIGFEELQEKIAETKSDMEDLNDTPVTFTISEHNEAIDNIRSTLSTLHGALNAFNSGTMDESMVLDLMQQFPELIPYIDLAADGFGNLSEGLSTLIAQQPDALIQSLQELKSSLNTDEERAQVDALIDSLQSLTSYGDSGMEAYATTVGSTWEDTANVIESVTTQFENLAKVQEAVANGLTMSTTAAAELAQIYPEILTNAEYAGNGQITLNEVVVKSILAGDESIINAQITKLEADKAELEARKETAIAELEIANQVGTARGQITEEELRLRIDAMNQELENEIAKNNQISQSFANTAENVAQNTEQLGNYNAEVADNMATNTNTAFASMADGAAVNAEASQYSLSGLAQKAVDVANAVLGIATGNPNVISDPKVIYKGKGGTNKGGIKKVSSPAKFSSVTNDYLSGKLSLDEFKSGLEVDISSYENAISNIDTQIDILKNLQATFNNTANSANGGIGGHDYSNKIKDLEKEKDKINSALDDAKKGSTKETKDEYQELVDFFERRNKVLNDALSLLKTNLDNVTGSFAKNKLVDAQLGVTEEKFKNYSDALNMYTQKANEALSKLPSDIAAKVKDGAVDLTTFVGEGNKDVVEAINDYEKWADKVADCKQELAELKAAIRQLELEKFNNIMEEFTNQFDLREDGKDLISKQIDLLKEAGQLIGESFFTSQIDQSKKQLALLEEEKKQLVEQMSSAIGSGRVQKGTEEWLSMVNALSDVEGNILDCKKAIEGFDNELLQLHWDIFDRLQGQFKDLDSELSNLRGLFDDSKVTDGDSGWSKEGIAQLGLLAQQYELAQYQVQQYNDELNQLSSDYLAGRYSATEYADRLSELSSAQWDAVNASESIKDAIVELNKVRIDEEISAIEKEIDTYKELIDSQIEALKSSKDLHDYQERIAEKSKAVTDLERQIAAMRNDTTAATVAKRKQLEEQLAEAKKELEKEQYEHSITEQENALNKEYENYENERNAEIEKLKASLEEREALIAASFETVKQNADIVGQEIALIAAQHGITISDAIISSWKNGETAIAGYGAVLSESTSAFIGNLIGVEYEVYNLQAQANETASSLAWMFATRADTLVGELAESYYSEQNLNAMTQALHGSLINTLEGGYNISSIMNALDGIAGGLHGVASAARDAAGAMAALGAAQAGAGSGSTGGSSSSSNNYSLVDMNTGRVVESGLSKEAAEEKQRKNTGRMYEVRRMAKGGIVTKEKNNPLNSIAEAVGEDTIIAAKEGEGVFTKEQTEALIRFAEKMGGGMDENGNLVIYGKDSDNSMFTSAEQFKEAVRYAMEPPANWSQKFTVDPVVRQPEIASNNANKNNVTIHYDNMINIQGDVNDDNHIVKQIENVATGIVDKAIKKSWKDASMTLKYGSY